MSDQFGSDMPFSKAEMMKRIHESYQALEEILQPLDEAQLTQSRLPGWTIKDHLAHLATWELGVAELLQRRDRFGAMQVQEAVVQKKSEDEINELIHRRHAGLSAAQAKAMFAEAHQQMLEALEPLSDEDLQKPYHTYLPEGSSGPDKAVWNWVAGNTHDHFAEHREYIREILEAGKANQEDRP